MNLLEHAAAALLGPGWTNPGLAHLLGMNPRTVRRMRNDGGQVPDGVKRDLETLLRDRGQQIDTLLETLAHG